MEVILAVFQRKNSLFFFALLGLCFLCFVPQVDSYSYNWDYMNCHNHGWYRGTEYGGDFGCNCTSYWGGIDCALCKDNSTCNDPESCANHMYIIKDNYYNCKPTKPIFGISTASIGAEFHFPDSVNGGGVIYVYDRPAGAPLDFTCVLSGCTKTEDYQDPIITCANIQCNCTEWCGKLTIPIVNDHIRGETTFECISDGTCYLTNKPLLKAVELLCVSAVCEVVEGPPIPPPTPIPHPHSILEISMFSGCLFAVVVICLVAFFVSRRNNRHLRILWENYDKKATFPATLTFSGVSCFLKLRRDQTKQILFNVSGIARPGQITAIMGPSGSGKTTLIDILARRKNIGDIKGTVLVNGNKRKKNFKRISGYVLQDDVMMGTLTVREQVTFAAMLRLPAMMPHEEKLRRVDAILEELGISHIADSQIGTDLSRGISGGERKRVSIATELVTNPSILFLDEPTSGLDAYNASSLIQTLKKLALEHNTTVIISIHQPRSDIFYQFDSLMLLSQGKMVYSGSPLDSVPYFSNLGFNCPQNFNPADFIIDTITSNPIFHGENEFADIQIETNGKGHIQDYGDMDDFDSSPVDEKTRKHLNSEYASTFSTQFLTLSRRTFVNILRNPYLLRAQYILTIVLGLLVGVVFKDLGYDTYGVQGRAGCTFFLLCLLAFSSISSLDTFFHERALFVRERAQGSYRTSAYFLAKAICDIVPMRVIPPILLGTITYWLMGHPQADSVWMHYVWFVGVLVLVSVVACALSLALSSSLPSMGLSNLVAILILLFFMLFGGLLANKTTIPPYIIWFKWLSFMNYGYEILMVNELQGTEVIFNPPNFPPVPTTGEEFLEQFDMDPDRWNLDFGVLFGMLGFYLLLSYLFLRFYIKERR